MKKNIKIVIGFIIFAIILASTPIIVIFITKSLPQLEIDDQIEYNKPDPLHCHLFELQNIKNVPAYCFSYFNSN